MRTGDLCEAMNRLSPEHLAEPWDNVGLLLGDVEADVRDRVLLTIDLTDDVAAEAERRSVGAVVAYHPPIFKAVKRLTAATREGRVMVRLARMGAAVYSPHTALDAASGGVADWLLDQATGELEKRGTRRALVSVERVDPTQTHKLVVFVPHDDVERVAAALADAGAGVIGDYTRCSYRIDGHGTFLPGDATNPTIGERGQLEEVDEVRLETVVPSRRLADVLAALYQAHPYEEPAFDVFKREPTPDASRGVGRRCELRGPTRLSRLAETVKAKLGLERVRIAADDIEAPIERVAVCPGAGVGALAESGLLADEARGTLFVTGEMSHHDVLAARAAGCAVLLAGHTRTERGYLAVLRERLAVELGDGVDVAVSGADAWPITEV